MVYVRAREAHKPKIFGRNWNGCFRLPHYRATSIHIWASVADRIDEALGAAEDSEIYELVCLVPASGFAGLLRG